MYDYVTINPKKPKQITWRYLPNPRKKRQKLPDEQLEIPQILEREWILLILYTTYSLNYFSYIMTLGQACIEQFNFT